MFPAKEFFFFAFFFGKAGVLVKKKPGHAWARLVPPSLTQVDFGSSSLAKRGKISFFPPYFFAARLGEPYWT